MAMVMSGFGGGGGGAAKQPTSTAEVIINIGKKIHIDPIMDSDLTWIVEEYINAPLPDEWSVVRAPSGEIHYINSRTRDNVLDNPIEPRYRKLVEIIKNARRDKIPVDEVTLMELMDPIERAADVKEMAEYMGIDVEKEMHLLWVAKLAVIESLPEGWEETQTADGRILYINQSEGSSTDEHPLDEYFKDLLARERAKRAPYYSTQGIWYKENSVVHYRNDQTAEGTELRTEVVPATGTYIDMFDLYGNRYWYDLRSERITFDYEELREEPAACAIQRIFRGHKYRKELYAEHFAAKKIATMWRHKKFQRVLRDLVAARDKGAKCMQGLWRMRVERIANSKAVFKRLGELGQRRGRKTDKTSGLQGSGYSFGIVRNHVTFIQRAMRKWILRKVIAEMRTVKPYPYDFYIVRRAVKVIQRNWRAHVLSKGGAGGQSALSAFLSAQRFRNTR
mmetsp:Transcript_791/g.1852  ORF Transcript_791/g.1852 Transcript_791/m.1852 type:complete len:450 (+) Transcript_791:280-1629(+)|eukprot:CAMPEP_0197576880 /NCGR_PEP_ID=MMETSP1326-20131121/1722_1 /TAXON_ID=1155430 /ORGANISM="Genus nov. species nov., Strain RCC2288" /LENGTH=449 /DNA_ID=CAMNT_0043139857 /DNA_START=261 /DNA_END=1610 /DNA_ORIENTATION=-